MRSRVPLGGVAALAALLGIAAVPAVGYSAGTERQQAPPAQSKPKRGDGWLTGRIVGRVGRLRLGETRPAVGGWVHILTPSGKAVALRYVSARPFRITLLKGEYEVFASRSREESTGPAPCRRRVEIRAGQPSRIRLFLFCHAK